MRLVLASGNRKKLAEMQRIFEKMGIEMVCAPDIGVSMDDCEETGDTFEENAQIKALYVMKRCGEPSVADDSGLEVFALDNRPGVYSARYGGDGLDDGGRTALLLKELEKVPDTERGGRFVSCICCAFPDGTFLETRGECEGEILRETRGTGGFGYDPVFLYPPLSKSYAELSPEEKDTISHRAKSLEKFAEGLCARLIGE